MSKLLNSSPLLRIIFASTCAARHNIKCLHESDLLLLRPKYLLKFAARAQHRSAVLHRPPELPAPQTSEF